MFDRKRAVYLGLGLVALTAAFGLQRPAGAAASGRPAARKGPDLARAARLIGQLTNDFRRRNGRAAVAESASLNKAAAYFAGYMARTNRYSHTADGARWDDRAVRAGFDGRFVSENIAVQFNTAGFTTEGLARKFFESWKSSPGHRRNMLDGDMTDAAVAIAWRPRNGYYFAVQMFGRPASRGTPARR